MTETAKGLASEVQRYGLLSAALVVNRYAAVVDRVVPGPDHASGDVRLLLPPASGDLRPVAEVVAQFAEASLRLLDAGAALVEQACATSPQPADDLLELPPVPAGACSEAPAWVHNPTDRPAEVEVHASPLVGGDGSLLVVEVADGEGGRRVALPPGASRQVVVRVAVPAGHPAGRHHGLLVASGTPDPVRVTLVVSDGADPGPADAS